jgi:hypothetical protein
MEHGSGTASGTGTTGAWHAASGSSGGWQQWQVDLSGFAGQQVELSISYASDWSFQGLGVFVDDIEVSTGEGTTSFEAGLDAGAFPAPRLGARPTPTTSTGLRRPGSPKGPLPPPQTPSTSASASRASPMRPTGTR